MIYDEINDEINSQAEVFTLPHPYVSSKGGDPVRRPDTRGEMTGPTAG